MNRTYLRFGTATAVSALSCGGIAATPLDAGQHDANTTAEAGYVDSGEMVVFDAGPSYLADVAFPCGTQTCSPGQSCCVQGEQGAYTYYCGNKQEDPGCRPYPCVSSTQCTDGTYCCEVAGPHGQVTNEFRCQCTVVICADSGPCPQGTTCEPTGGPFPVCERSRDM
jgi:hypothetical protein